MQFLLRGLFMRPKLDDWEKRPFAPGVLEGPRPRDNRDCYERDVAKESPGPPEKDGAFSKVAAAILRYEIFPPSLVSGVIRRAPVEVGDTVGILFHAPGGVDLFFAARVIDAFDGPQEGAKNPVFRTGFTYRTLLGHPELGEETFAVEKDAESGVVRVSLKSWSRPGTLLARACPPLVRHLQITASHAALKHLEGIAKPESLR